MSYAFSDVNFIPEEIDILRGREIKRRSANKYSIVLAGLIFLAGISLFGYNIYQKSIVSKSSEQIVKQQNTIEGLKEFGKNGYKLGVRLGAIKNILNARSYYSVLLEEIDAQTPDNVYVIELKVSGGNILLLEGQSFPSYGPISPFQKNLQNSDKGFFKDIKLESAKLNKESGKADFSLKVFLDVEKLNAGRK